MLRVGQPLLDEISTRAGRGAGPLSYGLIAGRGEQVLRCYPLTGEGGRKPTERITDSPGGRESMGDMEARGLEWLGFYLTFNATVITLQPDFVARQLSGGDFCLVVSRAAGGPSIPRAFRLADGNAFDEELEVESSQFLERRAAALRQVRAAFAGNRYLGWHAWFTSFRAAHQAGDYFGCEELISELSCDGYDPSPAEAERLAELRDMTEFHRGGSRALEPQGDGPFASALADLESYEASGLSALWGLHERLLRDSRRRNDGAAEAASSLRLGLIFQRRGLFEAARAHYQRALEIWEEAGEERSSQNVRNIQFTLRQEEETGARHVYFEKLWEPILRGAVDPAAELRVLTTQALDGDDWRRGREAVGALEQLGDWDAVEAGLVSPAQATSVAAVAALRRRNATHYEQALVRVLLNQSPLIRWQAALALGRAGGGAIQPLLRAARQDTDVGVRFAAVASLGRIGDPSIIPSLLVLPAATDVTGVSLQTAVHQAIAAIEARHPRPALSTAPTIVRPPAPTVGTRPRPVSARPPVSTSVAQPPPGPPAVRTRPQAETVSYVRTDRLFDAAMLAAGVYLISFLGPWVGLGYLLYALFVKVVVEPARYTRNFYADKPCYSGRGRGRVRPRRDGGEAQTRHAVIYAPLKWSPLAVAAVLLFAGQLTWKAMILAPLFVFVIWVLKSAHMVGTACQYCPARGDCRRWEARLKYFSPQLDAGGERQGGRLNA